MSDSPYDHCPHGPDDVRNDRMTAKEYRAEHRTEEDIHKAVVDWADRQATTRPALYSLFHVPNGGSRHTAEAEKLRQMGTRQGVPDLLLPVPATAPEVDGTFNGLALELKSPGGRLRPKQAWWLSTLQSAGWAIAIGWTFEEAKTLIQDYLAGEHEPQELDLSGAEPPRHVAE